MQIRFAFSFSKAVQAMSYLLARLGSVEKVKLMKLIYLADRAHFIQHGAPITGDRPYAMKYGPVPSNTLEMINGEWALGQDVFKYIHLDDRWVSLRNSPGEDALSASERGVLDDLIRDRGSRAAWDLVNETHKLPEYVESYVEGSAQPIPYERIAKHTGDEARFRMNRAVVGPDTAAQMHCPFPPDEDL